MAGHVMHHEFISVKRSSIERLIAHGGKCVAVGTTSVRTLESLYYIGVLISRNPDADEKDLAVNQWFPYEYAESGEKPLTTLEALGKIVEYLDRNNLHTLTANTQIIIAPGYDYHNQFPPAQEHAAFARICARGRELAQDLSPCPGQRFPFSELWRQLPAHSVTVKTIPPTCVSCGIFCGK